MKSSFPLARLFAASTLAFAAVGAQAANWYPFPVDDIKVDGQAVKAQYVPLDKASEAWNICVSFPHMKDAFYLAGNYGLVEEAKRLGVKIQLLDAGGFTQLANQISQIENCVAGGAKAVVIAAISQDGLNNLVTELKKKGVPVVDVYNGISSKDVSAHVLTIPRDEGYRAGKFLAEKHPAGSKPVRVGWFPGPAGAGWVELFNEGFTKAIKGSAVQIVETKYGDTGKEVQSRLIEDLLQTHKNVDYIAGNAVTAEAAVPVIRARGMTEKTKIVSVYLTPGVYQGLRNKTIEAANVSPIVTTARIAIDQAVRLIEKKPVMTNVGPFGRVYTAAEIKDLDASIVLAPASFKPTFRVGK